MVTFPISVGRDSYRGNDARKRSKTAQNNRDAMALEQAANDLLRNQEEPIRSYRWHELCQASGLSLDTVKRLGFSIDCGHNGYTAIKPGLSFDEATNLLRQEPPSAQ